MPSQLVQCHPFLTFVFDLICCQKQGCGEVHSRQTFTSGHDACRGHRGRSWNDQIWRVKMPRCYELHHETSWNIMERHDPNTPICSTMQHQFCVMQFEHIWTLSNVAARVWVSSMQSQAYENASQQQECRREVVSRTTMILFRYCPWGLLGSDIDRCRLWFDPMRSRTLCIGIEAYNGP